MASRDIFEKVFYKFTLPHEGKVYTNIPGDVGGPTYCGVTQKTYDEYRTNKKLSKQSVKLATDLEVGDIYFNMYWIASGCDALEDKIAMCVFDGGVNFGVSRAKRYLTITKDPENYLKLRETFYNKIVQNKPDQSKFLKGWLKRVNDLRIFINT